jgi:hypothetical protein
MRKCVKSVRALNRNARARSPFFHEASFLLNKSLEVVRIEQDPVRVSTPVQFHGPLRVPQTQSAFHRRAKRNVTRQNTAISRSTFARNLRTMVQIRACSASKPPIWPQNERGEASLPQGHCLIFRQGRPCINPSRLATSAAAFVFRRGLARLGMDIVHRKAKVGTPKHKKMRPPGSQGVKGLSAEKEN